MANLSPDVLKVITNAAPWLLFFAVLYMLIYRPQQKEKKNRADFMDNLKKGDRVISVGGMYGTITTLSPKTVTLKVSEKVEIEFSRNSIGSYQNDEKNGGK